MAHGVCMVVDALMNGSIAIIALRTGGGVYVCLRIPHLAAVPTVDDLQTDDNDPPLLPVESSPLMPSVYEDANCNSLETADNTATSLNNDNRMATTTPGTSDDVTNLSDQTPASSAWNNESTGNDTSRERPAEFDVISYISVGPVMFIHFPAVNTSNAGFTADLLFEHPIYLKASIALFRLF